jgi:hypothetical protein
MATKIIFKSLGLGVFLVSQAGAFCGFYVAKAGTDLFNKASKVVLVRDENKTVITMANDFEGDAKNFALVVPVPEVLSKEQIHVTENKYLDHLDAYTAPRLVEYFDEDPCRSIHLRKMLMFEESQLGAGNGAMVDAQNLGVKIEAQYSVEEYDVMILSGKESQGLLTWLRQEGYALPEAAAPVVESYLKQGLFFFVAKVNLDKMALRADKYLRPLQVAFESPKFSLPVRLGTLNSKGSQDLFVFALTKKGRVEASNYRTIKIPSGQELPTYLKTKFSTFYQDMYSELVRKEGMDKLYLEYAWDMGWCDPCAADPLSKQELSNLGVFWDSGSGNAIARGQNVYVTRLHARYTSESFPADIQFQVTPNKENFQGRYILRHPWTGNSECEAQKKYQNTLLIRQEQEAQSLASLTGWDIANIRKKAQISEPTKEISISTPFWEKLWGN